MNFRLTSARLLVSTYGKAFAPEFRAAPHVLAASLTGAAALVAALEQQQKTWTGNNLASPEAAITKARADIGAALSTVTGKVNTIESVAAAYKPIYDSTGTIVGHETVGWLYEDGKPVTKEFFDVSGALEVGMVACVFIAAVPA